MHKIRIVVALGLATALTVDICAREETRRAEVPTSALIIIEGVHSRDGIGQTKAISILDRSTVEKLAAFFPDYDKRASSDIAGGWEAGYRVYFNFKKGRAIRVTVSENGGGDTWSLGDGDFNTKGDFAIFVAELRRRAAR